MKRIALFFAILLCSCSTISETHYFKDTLEPVPNYYKVEITGSSFMSNSRYVSGYYDRNAIQEYFGEISQPKEARFVPLSCNCAGDPQNKELVLLLSTNSDAIANSISNMVKNKNIINSISLIANKGKIESLTIIESDISELDTKMALFASKADTYLDIDTTGTVNATEVRSQYLQFVKSEVAELYPGIPAPNTLAELYQWLLLHQ